MLYQFLLLSGCLSMNLCLDAAVEERTSFKQTAFEEEEVIDKGWPRGHKGDRGPRGHKGHKGDRGPRGHKGHTGATGATGATGEIGPEGPTGPTGAAETPANLYATDTSLFSISGNESYNTVFFDNVIVEQNILPLENVFQILETGIYEISFFLGNIDVIATPYVYFRAGLDVNGTIDPGSSEVQIINSTDSFLSGTFMKFLNAGDIISIRVKADATGLVTLNPTVDVPNRYIAITKTG